MFCLVITLCTLQTRRLSVALTLVEEEHRGAAHEGGMCKDTKILTSHDFCFLTLCETAPTRGDHGYNPTLCVKGSGGRCARAGGDNASCTMHNIVI